MLLPFVQEDSTEVVETEATSTVIPNIGEGRECPSEDALRLLRIALEYSRIGKLQKGVESAEYLLQCLHLAG